MATQLKNLASMVNGRLVGDGDVDCSGAHPPTDAAAGEITMIDDVRRANLLEKSRAVAVVSPAEIPSCRLPQIIVESPHAAFSLLVQHFRPPVNTALAATTIDPSAKIAPTASVHPSVVIGANVAIGERCRLMPGVVIMPHCVIGEDCVLYPNVTLYEHTHLENCVVIHAGSVLGAHGFGYRQQNGRHVPTAQLGYVHIADDVELGAGVTIDRGTYGSTRVGEGTKIDNQVMIAHNCQIGRHNLLCSQVGIAGSCRTGDYVILAGQVGLKDHVSVGDGAVIAAQAGVMEDCEAGQVYFGSPATTQREQMQIIAIERRLPDMRKEVKHLRRDVDRLQERVQNQIGDQPEEKRAA